MYFCVNMHWNTTNDFFLYYFIIIFLCHLALLEKSDKRVSITHEREREKKQATKVCDYSS